MLCPTCGWPISHSRIQFFQEMGMGKPDTCIVCAPQDKPVTMMMPEGKTGAGNLVVIQPEDTDLVNQAKREHRRGR